MGSNSEQVDSVTVVGGGDVGLLTALALEKGLDSTDVVVVDDFEESVPEVGKSTLSYVVDFLLDSLEIDVTRLISDVKLAWKATVYFEDWCGSGPFHSPLGQPLPVVREEGNGSGAERNRLTPTHEAEFQEWLHRYREGNFATTYTELAETPGEAPVIAEGRGIRRPLPSTSYHFDSRSFNEFLRTLCGERGVRLVDDRITAVETSDDRIDRVAGDETTYEADLYVDASGFERVLMGELDNEFVEFDLPVDSAVVTNVDIPFSEIVSATVVTTGDAGWFWQIDTAGDGGGARDLGYVYSSEHISDEAARREFVDTRDEEFGADDTRLYRFDSGVLAEPWYNNCVAAGNALGFVEPLQSTALTTSCLLAARLARALGQHARVNHEGVRRMFNQSAMATWEEVYDFVSVYYKHNSGSTQFWEDARSVNPGELEHHRSYQELGFAGWKDVYRHTRTGTDLNEYYLYYLVYRNLGVESAFYEGLDLEVDQEVIDRVEEYTASLPDQIDDYLGYEEFHGEYHPGYD
ncbi:MAG: FAD-dependent oxidoreductase [Halolamina sp.]|uniref:FAD-dependent oxidoreductase n=1 Tax=Halolamina sp. TaxID=1940283 RepID=UPI002FC3D14C